MTKAEQFRNELLELMRKYDVTIDSMTNYNYYEEPDGETYYFKIGNEFVYLWELEPDK